MKHTLGFLVGATFLFQIAVALPPPVRVETPTPSAIAENAGSPPAKSAFKGRRHVNGTITNRGVATGNALDTPLGRYEKLIRDAIGVAWYRYVAERSEFLSLGTIRISFFVDPTGRIKELKVVQNSSNEAFANVCLQSILELKLPAIPEKVAEVLPAKGLSQEMSFTLFPDSKTPQGPSNKASATASPTPEPRPSNTGRSGPG